MERKSVNVEAGLTQAERVKELDRSREVESGTVTLSSMPSKNKCVPDPSGSPQGSIDQGSGIAVS